jgi:hypothetical protein
MLAEQHQPSRRPKPVLTVPLQLVPGRTLAAEACASAALGLVQSPALWEALHTLALMLDAAEHLPPDELGATLAELLGGGYTSPAEAEQAVSMLETVHQSARTWAEIAHPGARNSLRTG